MNYLSNSHNTRFRASKRRRRVVFCPYMGITEIGTIDLHETRTRAGEAHVAPIGKFAASKRKRNNYYGVGLNGLSAGVYQDGTLISGTTFNNAAVYGGYSVAFEGTDLIDHTDTYDLTRGVVGPGNDQTLEVPVGFGMTAPIGGFSGPITTNNPDTPLEVLFHQSPGNLNRVRVLINTATSARTRNTLASTAIATLSKVLAGGEGNMSLAEIKEGPYTYTATGATSIVEKSNNFSFTNDFSINDFWSRLNSQINDSITVDGIVSSLYAKTTLNRTAPYAAAGNPFLGLLVGGWDNVDTLTLTTPVVNQVVYYQSQASDRTGSIENIVTVDVNIPGLGVPLNVGQMITLIEGLPAWSQTIYETRLTIADPWVTATQADYTGGSEVPLTQNNAIGGSVRIYGISAVTNNVGSITDTYTLRKDLYPVGVAGYLCVSLPDGTFDVFNASVTDLDSLPLFAASISEVNNPTFTPPTLSYAQATINQGVFVGNFKWWPHAIGGETTWAAKNWVSMQVKPENTVLYSDKQPATFDFDDGGIV